MKVLIIEDDETKISQLKEYFSAKPAEVQLNVRNSYQSGLRELIKNSYDLLILDMSMPMFDKTIDEPGGNFERFAGEKLLREMVRKKREVKTILFTMFESFGEGNSYITLDKFNQNLKIRYSGFYMDCVHYNAAETRWKIELDTLMEKCFTI